MRVGFSLVPDDPFWVQVREAAWQRAAELGVTLVQVPLLMARMGDESLGFLEDLKAQELGALITPLLTQSQMLSILEADLPIICADETPLRHPRLVSPQGLYDAAALSTRFLAGALGVSDTYVSRIFRRVTGMALWDYVHPTGSVVPASCSTARL